MRIINVIIACFICQILAANSVYSKEISKKTAIKVFNETKYEIVYCKWKKSKSNKKLITKILIENDFALGDNKFSNNATSLKPTKKIMDYLIMPTKDTYIMDNPIFICGKIEELDVIQKKPLDLYTSLVYFSATINPSDLGKMFIGENEKFNIAVKYSYTNEGWLYHSIDLEETQKINKDSLVKIVGIYNIVKAMLTVLDNMHRLNLYSDSYVDMISWLEPSKSYNTLKRVAWAYVDNGKVNKGVDIYRNRIMPIVKKTNNQLLINEYEDDFKRILLKYSN